MNLQLICGKCSVAMARRSAVLVTTVVRAVKRSSVRQAAWLSRSMPRHLGRALRFRVREQLGARRIAVVLGFVLTVLAGPTLAPSAQAHPSPAPTAPNIRPQESIRADLAAAASKKKYKPSKARQKEIRTNQKVLKYAFNTSSKSFNYKKAKRVDQKYYRGEKMLPALAWGIWRSNNYDRAKVKGASKADWVKIIKLDDAAWARAAVVSFGRGVHANLTCTGTQGRYSTNWRVVYLVDSCGVNDIVFYGAVCAAVAGFAATALGDPRLAIFPGLVALECGVGAAAISHAAGKSDIGAVAISWWIKAALLVNAFVYQPGVALIYTVKAQ